MKKKPRGAPKGSANAAKDPKERRIPLQVRIAPDAAALLAKYGGKFKNEGHAVDFAIRQTWESKIGPPLHEGTARIEHPPGGQLSDAQLP